MPRLTDKTELTTTPASDDLFEIIDISDLASSPQGTTKKIVRNTLFTSPITLKVKNNTLSTITKGQVVRVTGNDVGTPTIELAQADSVANSDAVIGIVSADIVASGTGFVVRVGTLTGTVTEPLDTSTFSGGDLLFLSSGVAGGLTNVAPTAGNIFAPIAVCTVSDITSGRIEIFPVYQRESTISGATNGLSVIGDNIGLGGSLTQSTLVNLGVHILQFQGELTLGNSSDNVGILSENADINFGVGANSNSVILSSGLVNVDGSGNVISVTGSSGLTSTGSYNIGIGHSVIYDISGDRNIAIGDFAMGGTLGTVSGDDNVGIGTGILANLTTGNRNVAIGNLALEDLTTASDNVALGSSAGQNITTGQRNVIVGSNNLLTGTTTRDCVFIGSSIATTNNPGPGNIALGGDISFADNVTANILLIPATSGGTASIGSGGSRNIAIGENVIDGNTTGQNNILVGTYCANLGVTGNSNIGIGPDIFSLAALTGADNVVIGRNSLRNTTSGSNNIVLGVTSGDNITIGSRNIVIGEGVDPALGTGNDQMNIGDTIFGNVNSASVKSIGIGGMPDASAKLDVQSTSQGFLAPRMTTAQRLAILTPATGLLVYDTDYDTFGYWDGVKWVLLSNEWNNVVTTTAAVYNITVTDDIILANSSLTAQSIVLPTAVGITGKSFTIKAVNITNGVTIDTTGGETIDGSASLPIYNLDESQTVVSDGTNWRIINDNESDFIYFTSDINYNVSTVAELNNVLDILYASEYDTISSKIIIQLADGVYALDDLTINRLKFRDKRTQLRILGNAVDSTAVVLTYNNLAITSGNISFRYITFTPLVGAADIVSEQSYTEFNNCIFDGINVSGIGYFITAIYSIVIVNGTNLVNNNTTNDWVFIRNLGASNTHIEGTLSGAVRYTIWNFWGGGSASVLGTLSTVFAGLTAQIKSPITEPDGGGDVSVEGGTIAKMSTTERANIPAPINAGYKIYNTTTNRIEVYNGTSWIPQETDSNTAEAIDGSTNPDVSIRFSNITLSGTDTSTLANGTYEGQRKTLSVVAEGATTDSLVVTVTTGLGLSSITFLGTGSNIGDTVDLIWKSGAWRLLSYSGNVVTTVGIAGTPGSVLFYGSSGEITQDNSNFFWDDSNNRLGVGTALPDGEIHIKSTVGVEFILEADSDNSGENDNPIFRLRQDGGVTTAAIGLEGSSGFRFTNSLENSLFVSSANTPIQFASGGAVLATLLTSGKFGIGTNAPNTTLDVQGGQTVKVTTVNTATYSLLVTDYILHVTRTTTGTCVITIPSAQIVSGRTFIVKDAGGNASTFNITVQTEGAETIDGGATDTIAGDYLSRTYYSDGTNLFII